MFDTETKQMDFPGLYEITASVFLPGTVWYSVSFSFERGRMQLCIWTAVGQEEQEQKIMKSLHQ